MSCKLIKWRMAEDKSMSISDNSELALDICGQATTYLFYQLPSDLLAVRSPLKFLVRVRMCENISGV